MAIKPNKINIEEAIDFLVKVRNIPDELRYNKAAGSEESINDVYAKNKVYENALNSTTMADIIEETLQTHFSQMFGAENEALQAARNIIDNLAYEELLSDKLINILRVPQNDFNFIEIIQNAEKETETMLKHYQDKWNKLHRDITKIIGPPTGKVSLDLTILENFKYILRADVQYTYKLTDCTLDLYILNNNYVRDNENSIVIGKEIRDLSAFYAPYSQEIKPNQIATLDPERMCVAKIKSVSDDIAEILKRYMRHQSKFQCRVAFSMLTGDIEVHLREVNNKEQIDLKKEHSNMNII